MADQYSMKRDKKVMIIIYMYFVRKRTKDSRHKQEKKKHYEYMLTKYNAQRG